MYYMYSVNIIMRVDYDITVAPKDAYTNNLLSSTYTEKNDFTKLSDAHNILLVYDQ